METNLLLSSMCSGELSISSGGGGGRSTSELISFCGVGGGGGSGLFGDGRPCQFWVAGGMSTLGLSLDSGEW